MTLSKSSSTSSPTTRPALSVYYGPPTPRSLRTLGGFDCAIVQTTLYSAKALEQLRLGGTRVLGYLSVGEDYPHGDWASIPGSAEYHCHFNPEWNSVSVDAAHPAWRSEVLRRAGAALQGADGLLLDTLDSADPAATLSLIAELRLSQRGAVLIANRGIDLLPGLAQHVDGVLFEALSTTHSPRYARHKASGLEYTEKAVQILRGFDLEISALDYARTPALARFARQRAARLGLSTFVSDRELSLPGGFS